MRIRAGSRTLVAEVAATDESRTRGLMGRSSLPRDGGMLFVFASASRGSFWMKDTLIPLSIAFLRDWRVVAVLEMVPCRAEPCPMYTPDAEFDAAIEMSRGWFSRAGVRTGDRLEVRGPFPTPAA